MEIKQAISRIVDRHDLDSMEMRAVMQQIMSGSASPIQIGGFLAGLRTKGETVVEITAAAQVMRELAIPVDLSPEMLVDTCGTGGDGSSTFNVSTAAAFVVAACGGRVAKHGNRSMSSKSGSADVLEALGVKLDLGPDRVVECVDAIGIGFMYAPAHHSAARHASEPRRELGTRTLFNLLGPLTNPASAPNQVLGVFAARWVEPMAKVLRELGSRHVMVVHAEDGLDEISIAAPTLVSELRDRQIRSYRIDPRDLGLVFQSLDSLRVDSPQASAKMINRIFAGETGPGADMVAINAGAALYVAGVSASFPQGVDLARKVLVNGDAAAKVADLVRMTA